MEILEQIEKQIAEMRLDAQKFYLNGNKAAGTRVRVAASSVQKQLKALRLDVLHERNS